MWAALLISQTRKDWDSSMGAQMKTWTAQRKLIEVVAYRAPDGRPTCCADARISAVCMFFSMRHFGSMCWCGAKADEVTTYEGSDYTKPLDGCPVWEAK